MKYIEMVGLQGFQKAYPKALSGGIRQRVSIARVLANDPPVILLGEPFAALDAMTRQVLQEQLVDIYETSRKTIVFITHSIDEALLLATRIIILGAKPGRVVQEINTSLPRPRNADVQLSPRFNELLPENPVGFNKPTATSFDVIVIGAGFTGLAAARRLAELNSDAKILIIDASRIGEGSSGRNSGTH